MAYSRGCFSIVGADALRSAYPDEHLALDLLIERLPTAVSNNLMWSSFTDVDYFLVFVCEGGSKREVRIPKDWDLTGDAALAKVCLEAP